MPSASVLSGSAARKRSSTSGKFTKKAMRKPSSSAAASPHSSSITKSGTLPTLKKTPPASAENSRRRSAPFSPDPLPNASLAPDGESEGSSPAAAGAVGAMGTATIAHSPKRTGISTSSAASSSRQRKSSNALHRPSRTSSIAKGGRKRMSKARGSRVAARSQRNGCSTSALESTSSPSPLALATAALEAAEEEEQTMRHALEMAQETDFDGLRPVYNALVMSVVQSQVAEVNAQQRALSCLMETFTAEERQDRNTDGGRRGSINLHEAEALVERLHDRLQSDAVAQLQQLRAENATLRASLDDATLAQERKASEMEVLRVNYARTLARGDVEQEAARAEVQTAVNASLLDVERMKQELGRRIDIACASIRTPRYSTALTEMREMTLQVQAEVQEHHDTLSKLIASIVARDTFLWEKSDSMHSNLPTRYREGLRRLNRDQLLNMLDVLSFQDGVVDTVGKALYVLEADQYRTAVM